MPKNLVDDLDCLTMTDWKYFFQILFRTTLTVSTKLHSGIKYFFRHCCQQWIVCVCSELEGTKNIDHFALSGSLTTGDLRNLSFWKTYTLRFRFLFFSRCVTNSIWFFSVNTHITISMKASHKVWATSLLTRGIGVQGSSSLSGFMEQSFSSSYSARNPLEKQFSFLSASVYGPFTAFMTALTARDLNLRKQGWRI